MMSSADFTITNKSKTVQFDVHSRRGLKGDTGATGDSAYQAWLDLGNTGDEAAFVASLKGVQGDQGIQGIQGEKGDKGDTGDTGATGAKGDKGDTGAQGVQGIQGEQGLQGIQGIPGAQGVKGDTGAQGDPGVVQSVNGQSVANVVLDHTDVGADQAGAAAAAQVAAELHADIEVSNLNQSLGSAAFSDDSDFATAAQGALADTALQAETDPTVPSWAKEPSKPTYNKSEVGLSNVDNTSDADKPVSTAQQTALNAKANASGTVNLTGNQTVAGVKTFSSSPIVPTATTTTQAVNKSQMDTADALKVNKAGDTMSGNLTISKSSPELWLDGSSGAGSASLRLTGGTANGKSWNFVSGLTGNFAFSNNTTSNSLLIEGTAQEGMLRIMSDRLRTNGADYITGTGFPEGVVTAPVGSIYIDTAITNGASSWIKKSGTGNTGWQVLDGDTGWRDISAITAGLFDVVNPLDYGLYWRRIGNTMTFKMRSSLSRTDNTAVTGLPNVGNQGCTVRAFVQGSNTKFEDLVFQSGSLYPVNAGAIVGDRLGFVLTTHVGSAWPTTLPGVSA